MRIPPINESSIKHYQMIVDLTKQFGLGRHSIGMSGDYKLAINNGSTMIRVGSAIFGHRN